MKLHQNAKNWQKARKKDCKLEIGQKEPKTPKGKPNQIDNIRIKNEQKWDKK